MTQTQINNSIVTGLNNLCDLNQQLFDFWYSELYTADDSVIAEVWTERTLKLIEDDVMQQSLV
jgi:hypothetical protein